jgi:DNA polymerase-3 subunit delta
LISGDEPLQVLEAGDSIKAAASNQGYSETELMIVEPGFEWQELIQVSGSLSLFSERRLIDLRLQSASPGSQGSKALQAYSKQPPRDTLLLIRMGKLDRKAAKSAWFRALEEVGVVIQVWPLNLVQTQEWIAGRMKSKGLLPDTEAVRLLAARVEGNLLAARQEIEKLSLLYGQGHLDAAKVFDAVADCARFNIFDLADAALAGEAGRAVKVLHGLRAEAVGSPLVLWSLTEQVREMVKLSHELTKGHSVARVVQAVWQKRRSLFTRALSRYSYLQWCAILRHCAQTDRIIKGANKDREWDELLQLLLEICGQARPNADLPAH